MQLLIVLLHIVGNSVICIFFSFLFFSSYYIVHATRVRAYTLDDKYVEGFQEYCSSFPPSVGYISLLKKKQLLGKAVS